MATLADQIISIVDRLSHPSTDDNDVLNTVAGMRRKLKGGMASSLIGAFPGTSSRDADELRETIQRLHEELAELEIENEELRESQAFLRQELALDDNAAAEFTVNEVSAVMVDRFGKINGVGTAWAAYSEALHAEDADSPLVTTAKEQQWRRKNAFPKWAVAQLREMPDEYLERNAHRWTPDDIDFLCNLHNACPDRPYSELAAACSEKFDCKIGINSIRGKISMLRKLRRIAPVSR